MSDTKEVTLTPNKELLTIQRNSFAKQLIDNVLDYKRHLLIMKADPKYQRQNPQDGKFTGIEELVNNYRKAAVNAKSYLDTIDEMLKLDEAGTLANEWANLDAIPVNLEGGKE